MDLVILTDTSTQTMAFASCKLLIDSCLDFPLPSLFISMISMSLGSWKYLFADQSLSLMGLPIVQNGLEAHRTTGFLFFIW